MILIRLDKLRGFIERNNNEISDDGISADEISGDEFSDDEISGSSSTVIKFYKTHFILSRDLRNRLLLLSLFIFSIVVK